MWKRFAPLLTLVLSCCSWNQDYGKPAAQFEAADVTKLAKAFLNKKISVRGVVNSVDVRQPDHCLVRLDGGIVCDFGTFRAAANACKAGQRTTVDGILRTCAAGEALLRPAFGRDPKAPFTPRKK